MMLCSLSFSEAACKLLALKLSQVESVEGSSWFPLKHWALFSAKNAMLGWQPKSLYSVTVAPGGALNDTPEVPDWLMSWHMQSVGTLMIAPKSNADVLSPWLYSVTGTAEREDVL